MNENVKKVNNPLFNVAVTGGTFEDFSQNAILLPARDKTPPPTLNISPDQLLSEILPNRAPLQIEEPTEFENFQNQVDPPPSEPTPPPENSNPQPSSSQTAARSANFSSVFSSFSNILHIRPQSHTPKEEVVPPPAGIDALIGQNNDNVTPIPLFPTQILPQPQPQPPSVQGPVNVFRRPGLKRPAYAPVPGLSSTAQPPAASAIQPTFPLSAQPPPVQSFPATAQPYSTVQPPLPTVQHLPPTVQPPPHKIQPSPPTVQPSFPHTAQSFSATSQPSSIIQPNLPTVHNLPPTVQLPSRKIQPSPPVVQPSYPHTVQSFPATAQRFANVQSPLPTAQHLPSTVQPHTYKTQPSSFTVQSHNVQHHPTVQPAAPTVQPVQPFIVQPSPPTVPSQPFIVQPSPPIVQSQPFIVQASPTVQALPPTVHPPTSTLQSSSVGVKPHPPNVQPFSLSAVQPAPPTVQSQPLIVQQSSPHPVQSHHFIGQPPPTVQFQPLTAQQPPPPFQSQSLTVPPPAQPHSFAVQSLPGNIPPVSTLPTQPKSASSFFDITPSAPPLQSSTQELFSHSNLPNQFKPISPLPPSVNAFSHIPQPHPTLPVSQFLQSTASSTSYSFPTISGQSNVQSPVMAAIPASEALPNNLNMGSAIPDVYSSNNVMDNTAAVNQIYRPVYHHWFFQKEVESKKTWQPFSMIDSLSLEKAFTSNDLDPDKVIATDGGRFDVNILRRQKTAVYWNGTPTEVRRCSWFHKGSPDGRLVPYEENVSAKLEEEFKLAFELKQWHKKVELASGETVEFHGPDVLVVFPPAQAPDAWGNTPNQNRARVVKRGMDEFDIDEGEPAHVDHILFLVHGIGSVCDLKFRTVEEVVDEFRNIALQLVQSHYRTSCETGVVHRVEVLPISWHAKLHSDDTGIDKQLKSITLKSIPKLRDFTNDTLLDILFYTSPVYCQTIVSTVGNELNRIYELFKQRNPSFQGGISLGGHSLGSLILFDLLCHQDSTPEEDKASEEEVFPLKDESKRPELKRRLSRRISYMMGSVGTGQPQIYYPHLNFEPKTFFAIGSPIGMFVIVRGLDTLGENFSLPTCPAFFNIFHPYDPIAYRIESLIHPELGKLKPVLIPHHKGRKRMHLELKETMARVGADLKQRVIESMKSTWNSFYQFAMFQKPDQPSIEEEVQKAFEEQITNKPEFEEEPMQETGDVPRGSLNRGRRIDYILQEAPFEIFNEYIFALTSHVCYWESEDTILLILKEIYSSMGISTDSQIPQQSMTIERPPSSPTTVRSNKVTFEGQCNQVEVDPTRPIQANTNLQPPPVSGFVRKT